VHPFLEEYPFLELLIGVTGGPKPIGVGMGTYRMVVAEGSSTLPKALGSLVSSRCVGLFLSISNLRVSFGLALWGVHPFLEVFTFTPHKGDSNGVTGGPELIWQGLETCRIVVAEAG
jgi:hypothetical protein